VVPGDSEFYPAPENALMDFKQCSLRRPVDENGEGREFA
jgi:hypothetical protein